MTEQELLDEYKIIKDVEDEIDNLKSKRKCLVMDFLKKLPFQPSDIVENRVGVKYIIETLKDAKLSYGGDISISYTACRIKKNGEPYATPSQSWSIGNYFSLKKVEPTTKI